ncbi:FAD-dependent oxidoreductase [Piscinibacter sakaiensis]|uniref:FAD-dependent oxidoreductase n=1 Tax=Piscinibacter sakaiensis TaxID=1547922 RepID=UPI003AAD7F5E
MERNFVPYPFEPTRHAAQLPPLHDGVEPQRHRVVVVGGGPVGLCAALGLATQGVPVVLLEADDSVCAGSRAICISRRSLQIVERFGALDGFMKIGLPWTGGRSFYRDQQVLQFNMPQDENQKLPPMVNLAQYHIEQILLDRARELSGLIDIRWQTRVSGIETSDDGARLSVTTPAGDYALETDWLVAADGGRSLIRESLGLALHGTSYEGRYVIVDILLETDRKTERLAYFDPPCNPGSTVLVHKQPDNVWRIDYQLRDGEDPADAIKPENVMPRVESLLEMMGERGAWAPIWITIYKANALTLDRYRHGRVLFAGDAAHLLPIFGVRGANSGIDDADNLAWKLALVVKGLAGDALLDSYSDERVAAAHENLSHGSKSTEFMAPPSFAFDLMRSAVLGLAARHPALQSLINPRQTTAISYDSSPLNAAAAASAAFASGPAPGAVFLESPLTLLADGASRAGYLSDLAGPGFAALYFSDSGEVPATLREVEQVLHTRGIPFVLRVLARTAATPGSGVDGHDHTGRLFPMYGAAPGSLYLLRPDGHVLARWLACDPQEVEPAITAALGLPSTPGQEMPQ